MANSWLADGRKAGGSRDAFEQNYHLLPGKIRSLLKHMDPRSKSPRNTDKELAKFSDEEQTCLKDLLKYHQAFPLKHDYPKPRHQSKYRGKAKNMNHLIDKEKMKGFNKRG